MYNYNHSPPPWVINHDNIKSTREGEGKFCLKYNPVSLTLKMIFQHAHISSLSTNLKLASATLTYFLHDVYIIASIVTFV